MPVLTPRPENTDDVGCSVDVVAIDGPSGAGKSTVARALADRLGFAYLDTGAMYRAVTWFLLERDFDDLDDESALSQCLDGLDLELLPGGHVLIGGRDVTAHLRSREVEKRVSGVSAASAVRARMRDLQRQFAARAPVVAEGRDMASVVFPAARWKFYLDATPGERARRRHFDFVGRGRDVLEEEVLEEIVVRDRLDSTRQDAPLTRADDAIEIDSTDLDVAGVVQTMFDRIANDMPNNAGSMEANS